MIPHECGGANVSMKGANRIVAAPEVILLPQQYYALKVRLEENGRSTVDGKEKRLTKGPSRGLPVCYLVSLTGLPLLCF